MTSYAYQPLEDSVFGKLIGEVFQIKGISSKELLDSIYSNLALAGVRFVGTPKAEKQVILNILPDKFRKWISARNHSAIKDEFRKLAFGCKSEAKPKIDIALELLEWIFSGFDEDELTLELIRILTGRKIEIGNEFINELRLAYENNFVGQK